MGLKYFLTCAMMLLNLIPAFGQLDSVYYQFGVGSVDSGAVQTTDNFSAAPIPIPGEPKIISNPEGVYTESMFAPSNGSESLPPYVYVEDPNATDNPQGGSGQTVLLQKFPGIPMTNYIPPDCIMAVGPNHVIACVNSQFSIWDKQGNLLKTINAAQWWLPAWPDEAGDPQVIYDQFAGRWVLVWMQYNDVALTAGNLIAYSDDDDPLGTWYMYRLNTKTNGTVQTNNWGDYPQLGYDDEALYIMTRAFGFAGGGPFYSKFRVISKADLYTNSTGPLTYKDFWDIGLPGTPAIKPDGIHPTYCYTAGEGGYFFWANRSGGNYYAVYRFLNPTSSTPSLRGDTLRVQDYYGTPDANQLGGGSPLIASNGSHVKTSPVIRDGKMYVAHSVGNSTNPAYASAKYVIYDLPTNSIVEQAELGAVGYYYIFPTITVDKDHNIAVTFSRSATTEYIGAYYSTKYAGDPAGLSPSQPLAKGLGNYVLTYGGTRNRWGDYLGICIDPSNEYDVWLFPEYASATNEWGTMIGQIRMVPFSGIYTFRSSDSLAFGDVEINTISDTLEVVVANYGTDDLVISDIASNVGPFTLIPDNTFPQTLQTYDSLTMRVIFSPMEVAEYAEVLPIISSDPNFLGIQLTGNSYEIIQPFTDVFYASSGSGNNGDIITIDRVTGTGTTVGNSLYNEVKSMTVNRSNNTLYGLVSLGINSEVVRVNAEQGDCYTLFALDIPSLSGIDFDTSGTLYVSSQIGDIYSVDQKNGNCTLITSVGLELNAIAFNPITNELWGARRKTFGLGKDSLYTIDLATGIATPIGKTGFSVLTNDMAFDENDKLYGVSGVSNQAGKLFEISQVDGSGTLIGTGVGFNHTLGLAYSMDGTVSSVDGNESTIPDEFTLDQNYPNPFNPSTQIKFSLPVNANVKITVYNLLGQIVRELVNSNMNTGFHSVQWNSDDSSGKKVSSGIYFYEINANGIDGKQFNQVRKMMLLK